MKMYFSNKEVKVMESMLNDLGLEFSNLELLLDGSCEFYYAEDLKMAKLFDEEELADFKEQYGHIITIEKQYDKLLSNKVEGWWIEFNEDFFVDYMNIYRTTLVQVVRGIGDIIAKVSFFVKPMIENFIKKWKKPEVEEEVTWAKPTPAKTPVVDEEFEKALDEIIDEVYSAHKDEEF